MISHKHKAIFIHIPKCAGNTVNHLLEQELGFKGVSKTTGWKQPVQRLLFYRYYLFLIMQSRHLYSFKEWLKFAITSTRYLTKPVLDLNAHGFKPPDELSGAFRIGTLRRYLRTIPENMMNEYHKFTFVRNPYERAVSIWSFLSSDTRGLDKINVSFPEFITAVSRSDYQSLHPQLRPEIYADLEWHAMPQVSHLKNTEGVIDINFYGKLEHFVKDWQTVHQHLNLSYASFNPQVRLNTSKHENFKQYYTKELEEMVLSYYREDFEAFGYEKKI